MNEVKVKEIQIAGYIHTLAGRHLLVHPYPITKDSWQSDEMTRWLVVSPTHFAASGNKPVYHAPFHMVTTAPFVVEYTPNKSILIEDVQYAELEEYDAVAGEIEQPEMWSEFIQTVMKEN